MKNIVSMRWLLARMYEPDVVIADCRFLLGQPEAEDKPMTPGIFQELSISIWKKICHLLSLHTEDATRSLTRL